MFQEPRKTYLQTDKHISNEVLETDLPDFHLWSYRISNGFHQVKWISPSQMDFTKSDGFHQVRRISPSQMDFTKSNGFHQVKWISPSLRPRIITYRDNKNFNKAFRSEIQSLCSREADLGFFKTLFFTFSINMVISKGIFAQMKPLL